MRPLYRLAALCVTVLIVGQANASTYVPLSVSGTFTDPFRDTFALTGTLDVNATSGLVADATLQLAGEPWTNIISQGSAGSFYDLSIQTPIFNTGCSASNDGPGCHDVLNLGAFRQPLDAAGRSRRNNRRGLRRLKGCRFHNYFGEWDRIGRSSSRCRITLRHGPWRARSASVAQ